MSNEHEKNDKPDHGVIPFKIDNHNYMSPPVPNPVTGTQLRALPPGVTEEFDLWQRARGQEDDTIVEDTDEVTLEPGTHFYTAKREITPGSSQ